MQYDIYTGLLKAFPLPETVASDVNFVCNHGHPKFDTLRDSYPIEAIAGDGDDFSKAVNLLQWVSSNTWHKGDYNGSVGQNALDLLDYSFGKDISCGINCVGLAIVLAECLLAVGVKARKVFIMPCSPYDGDNHVVTHVYISEMNKWVMFDPTLNAYISNEKGEYLSLLELRNHLADQNPIFFNKGAKYNDNEWTEQSAKENTQYFAKNLFYFQTSEISTFNDDAPGNRNITLCPQGFDPKQKKLNNIDYRMKIYNAEDDPYMINWREWAEKEEYHYCSAVGFEQNPF
ncbi:MAG: transglutaminase-like domain-containing protein [Defluviitaleaceae bacterium]|nr:transglutaminase-like domain-containing protein [Defluviitaleaceae bacterium]